MKKTAYLIIVLIAAITSRAFSEEPVYFADSNLKAAQNCGPNLRIYK